MKTPTSSFIALAFAAMAASVTEPAQQIQRDKPRQYAAPDGSTRVAVIPVGKGKGHSDYENRIEFLSKEGQMFCAIEYSSEDGEHGFGVAKAEWTPDSRFFVFSLTSSGGHQAWHAPTQFYSQEDGTVRSLDDYFAAAGISKSDFRLSAPNTVKTEVWEDKPVAVLVKLSALPPLRSWRRTKPFLVECKEGRVIKPDQP